MPSSRGRPRLLFATQNEKVLSAPLKELLSFGMVASGQDLVGGGRYVDLPGVRTQPEFASAFHLLRMVARSAWAIGADLAGKLMLAAISPRGFR
jgi:hypothetical protein